MFIHASAPFLTMILCLGFLSCKNKAPATAEEKEIHAELQVLNEEYSKIEAELRELKGTDASMSTSKVEESQQSVLSLGERKVELQKEVQTLKADLDKYLADNF